MPAGPPEPGGAGGGIVSRDGMEGVVWRDGGAYGDSSGLTLCSGDAKLATARVLEGRGAKCRLWLSARRRQLHKTQSTGQTKSLAGDRIPRRVDDMTAERSKRRQRAAPDPAGRESEVGRAPHPSTRHSPRRQTPFSNATRARDMQLQLQLQLQLQRAYG